MTEKDQADVVLSRKAVFVRCCLKSITIPKKVTCIEADTFNNCKSITSVTIPNGVIDICTNAFRDCKQLASVTIPDTVTYIASDAFKNCSDSLEIHGKVGTEAETYANKKGIKFIAE